MPTVALPGGRNVRATLDRAPNAAVLTNARDEPADGDTETSPNSLVIMCPPHPRDGGNRHHPLLRAISSQLTAQGISCLRIDYGPWDGGRGERRDAEIAYNWARDRVDRVGLVGYSFGGAVALGAAKAINTVPRVSVIAPSATLPCGTEIADSMANVASAGQLVYGTRETTVDWKPVVEYARTNNFETVAIDADHHFVGQRPRVADAVCGFFGPFVQKN